MQKDNFELLKKAHDRKMPAFTFIAQDKCSREALKAYLDTLRLKQADAKHIREVEARIIEWDEWQENNPTKYPD